MAVRSFTGSRWERLQGTLLVALVVVVQLLWGAALVYLAVQFFL